MLVGSAQRGKSYTIHTNAQQLSPGIIENILGFHVLTGSDATSSLTGFGKKKFWKIYEQYSHLLHGIGRSVEDVEEFVCRLYGALDPLTGVNKCRHELFEKGNKQLEKLPPTKD